MYEIDLGNARLTAMRRSLPEGVTRYLCSEFKENDADWLLAKQDRKQ